MNILMTAALLAALTVPDMDTSFKAYMDYRAITNEESTQYRMQQKAETDENGLRTYKGRYMIAVGTYYGEVGDRLDITLDTGERFEAVIGDIKADSSTDSTHRYHPMENGGNVVEFIVDVRLVSRGVRRSGDISSIEGFEGNIEKIERAD